MNEMLLECRDLIKIYPSPIEGLKFPALRGLDLQVQKGEMTALIGPSGAGKTTLLRLISGFDIPSSGEIWFENQLLNQYSQSELVEYRLNKIGVMYQSPRDNLVWGLNVLDNILFPLRYSGKFGIEKLQRAKELLAMVGLKGKEKRKPSQLSGGEQQRVALAIALANEPTLLLADEPTGELDSDTTMLIIDYLKELNENLKLTIIVATHDKRFSNLTDRTYKIQDGRLTTFHFPIEDIALVPKREEVIIVDSFGNLRLPPEVLEKFKGLSAVKVQIKEDKIEIIPQRQEEE
jgi:ABC-type lipoprotein export system ATPase subunit